MLNYDNVLINKNMQNSGLFLLLTCIDSGIHTAFARAKPSARSKFQLIQFEFIQCF